MERKCKKCGGYLISERYWCNKGAANYIRCIYCGSYWFEETKDMEEEEIPPPFIIRKKGMSYAQIGQQLGLTKQRVHMICKKALMKIRRNAAESGWRI